MVAINAPVAPTVAPQSKLPFVKPDGTVTEVGKQFLQQLYNQSVGTNRVIPTVCSNAGNVFSLTLPGVSPNYAGYATHDVFSAVASATSTGPVTAAVVTPTGALKTVKVFKTNGSAQATTGDISSGLHYQFTFVDSLDGGNGGLVLR